MYDLVVLVVVVGSDTGSFIIVDFLGGLGRIEEVFICCHHKLSLSVGRMLVAELRAC